MVLFQQVFDALQFFGGEFEVGEGGYVVLDLGNFRGADECAGDFRQAEDPGEGHLGQGLAAGAGVVVEFADAGEGSVGDVFGAEEASL